MVVLGVRIMMMMMDSGRQRLKGHAACLGAVKSRLLIAIVIDMPIVMLMLMQSNQHIHARCSRQSTAE